MITIKDWCEGVRYRYDDVERFTWDCFGKNAVSVTSEWTIDEHGEPYPDGGRDYTVVYNPYTHEVFEVCSYSSLDCTALRWLNPKYKKAYFAEEKIRGMDNIFDFEDSIKFTEVKSPRGWSWLTKMFGF